MAKTEDVGIRLKVENGQAVRKLKGTEKELKSFSSKGKSLIGGIKMAWLGWIAVIATAGIALKKALNLAREAANLNQINMAFESMANAAGVSSTAVLDSMRKLSGETISTMEMIQSANKAMILGLPIDKLDQMMRIARASATATGSSVKQMFDDIVVGIGRQSRMILDNLGIIVEVEKANQDYAESMGIVGRKLDDTERRQAFLNAVLVEGERIIKNVGKAGQEATSAERWQMMTAAITDLKTELGMELLPAFEAVTEEIRGWARGMEETLKISREFKEAFKTPEKNIKKLRKEYKKANKELEEWGDMLSMIGDKSSLEYEITQQFYDEQKKVVDEILKRQQEAEKYYGSSEANLKRANALQKKMGNIIKENKMYMGGYQKMAEKWGVTTVEVLKLAKAEGDMMASILLHNIERLKELSTEVEGYSAKVEKSTEVAEENIEVKKHEIRTLEDLIKETEHRAKMIELLHGAEEKGYKTTEDVIKQYEDLLMVMATCDPEWKKQQEYHEMQLILRARLVTLRKKSIGVTKEETKTDNIYLEQQKALKQVFEDRLNALTKIHATEEGQRDALTALILEYRALGYEISYSSDAILEWEKNLGDAEKATTEYAEEIDKAAVAATEDFARSLIDLPFQEMRNELHLTIDAGDEFGKRLGKQIANLVIDLTFLLAKMALIKIALAALNIGTGGGGSFLMSLLGAKRGGEVGINVLKYAKGGPMPGRAGGDVNLGLFKKGEYLIPPEKVTSRTRPLLNAIRTGGVSRYAEGGEIGGNGMSMSKDVQIINVITEDMLMGVVDKNKKVIVNYINSDIVAGGVTRRIIKGAL